MRDLFIVSTPLYGYSDQIKNAFLQLGYSCDMFVYSIPNKYLCNIPVFGTMFRHKHYFYQNRRLIRKILTAEEHRTLLFFGMCEFSSAQWQNLRNNTKSRFVFWFLDSIMKHHNFYNGLTFCDLAFTYNKSDCVVLGKMKVKNMFLPLFFDPQYYYPLKTIDFEYDIFFIGALKSRIDTLNKLALALEPLRLKMGFFGRLSPMYVFLNRKKYKWFFKHHKNRSLDHSEINYFYNCSKLCINFQPVQAIDALNIRTYEVCGSGSLLVTDGNRELINDLFKIGEDLIYFEDFLDLLNIVKDFFGPYEMYNYDAIRSKKGFHARRYHTINQRVQLLANEIEMISKTLN